MFLFYAMASVSVLIQFVFDRAAYGGMNLLCPASHNLQYLHICKMEQC